MDKKLLRRSCGLILLSCLMLLALLTGCCREESQTNTRLTLTPVELSGDAKMLARTLGYESDDVQLLEYQLEGAEADRSQSLVLEIWRRTPSGSAWGYGCLQEAVTLEPGEEAWLRTQYELADESDVVIMPEYSQESFREALAVEGCVVLTAAFTAAE